MSHWCRIWDDMPTDTKWRTVAKRAGRPVSEVLAVFVHMMTNAANASERGMLESWNDEDVALAIDAEPDHVTAIREAMQGKTLDGNHLTGWEKRQPSREDGSAERAKAWRTKKNGGKNDKKRAETPPTDDERNRTQPNAAERQIRADRIDTDKKEDPVLTNGRHVGVEIVEIDDEPEAPPIENAEARLFRTGKALLGNNSGGQIAKLLKVAGNDPAKAQLAIDRCVGRQDPREYIAKIISVKTGPPAKRDAIHDAIAELRGQFNASSH